MKRPAWMSRHLTRRLVCGVTARRCAFRRVSFRVYGCYQAAWAVDGRLHDALQSVANAIAGVMDTQPSYLMHRRNRPRQHLRSKEDVRGKEDVVCAQLELMWHKILSATLLVDPASIPGSVPSEGEPEFDLTRRGRFQRAFYITGMLTPQGCRQSDPLYSDGMGVEHLWVGSGGPGKAELAAASEKANQLWAAACARRRAETGVEGDSAGAETKGSDDKPDAVDPAWAMSVSDDIASECRVLAVKPLTAPWLETRQLSAGWGVVVSPVLSTIATAEKPIMSGVPAAMLMGVARRVQAQFGRGPTRLQELLIDSILLMAAAEAMRKVEMKVARAEWDTGGRLEREHKTRVVDEIAFAAYSQAQVGGGYSPCVAWSWLTLLCAAWPPVACIVLLCCPLHAGSGTVRNAR